MRGRLPKTFTYTGTGAALSVNLGFQPKALIVYNHTDGDVIGLHIDIAAAGSTLKVVDSGSGTTDISKATAGFTLGAQGFSLGTDAALNESAKVYYGIAF